MPTLLASLLIVGAGFTPAELAALPKPDPHLFDKAPREFFTSKDRHGQPRMLSQAEQARVFFQKKAVAMRAQRRRMRYRQLDSQPFYDRDIIYAEGLTGQFIQSQPLQGGRGLSR